MSGDAMFGTILDGPKERDAIHVATAAVCATIKLIPGQDIGFVTAGDVHSVGVTDTPIGIVDPYLKHPIFPGQWFWMFLYPRTITSLHHNWTHPAFEAPALVARPESTTDDLIGTIALSRDNIPLPPSAEMSMEEAWLRGFADSNDVEYEELLDAANGYVHHREYLCDGGKWEGRYVPDEFWPFYEAVTKRKVAEKDRGSFFSCSC